jgi:hypothetical protein
MRRLLILGLLLAGCAGIPAVPAAPPPPEPVVLLLKAEARGGLCVTGSMCESHLTVMSDGAWTLVGNGAQRSGALPAGRVAALAEAVRRTGLALAPPFTGTCPIAYDGQEQVLTWLQDGAPVTVASCEREFDPHDPLVVAAADLAAELE